MMVVVIKQLEMQSCHPCPAYGLFLLPCGNLHAAGNTTNGTVAHALIVNLDAIKDTQLPTCTKCGL